jgi:hypothetical protein
MGETKPPLVRGQRLGEERKTGEEIVPDCCAFDCRWRQVAADWVVWLPEASRYVWLRPFVSFWSSLAGGYTPLAGWQAGPKNDATQLRETSYEPAKQPGSLAGWQADTTLASAGRARKPLPCDGPRPIDSWITEPDRRFSRPLVMPGFRPATFQSAVDFPSSPAAGGPSP